MIIAYLRRAALVVAVAALLAGLFGLALIGDPASEPQPMIAGQP